MSKTVTAAFVVAFPGLNAYTKFPAPTRSIMPGFPFVRFSSLINFPLFTSTSTRWLTATSVTNALPVTSENAAQHVAFWSVMGVDAETVAMLEDDKERVAEPKEASVTKMEFEFGISAVPKRTAVPAGEERTSCVETALLTTGKAERKPVLLTVGSPFTVVRRAVESALKKVCDMVLVGPTGGVVWLMSNARRDVSSGVRPFAAHIEKQAIPALAPELATQAWERAVERATLMGNSPRVLAGWPTMVSLVGSVESMVNIDTVFEPGLTATRF